METLKEVKTTGPSLEMIHYQYKYCTPKFYSKQVGVLCKSKEYDISLRTKPNRKRYQNNQQNSQHVVDNGGCDLWMSAFTGVLKSAEGIDKEKESMSSLKSVFLLVTAEKCPFSTF